MTELLNAPIVEQALELYTVSVGTGLALSLIAMALSWTVITVYKLLHKIFI